MQKSPRLNKNQKEELKNFVKDPKRSSRESRRAQAILMLDSNTDPETISGITFFKRRRIYELRVNYLESGIEAIEDKRKGTPSQLLTKNQREEILNILENKSPKDYGYDCPYWTTGIPADLIQRQYNVKYKSKTSFYIIFKEAKFTLHKPGRVL